MIPLDNRSVSVLGPDYEGLTLMSTGGMGVLYRAHKRGLDVDVVVKRVKPQFRGRMSETREANILKKLRSQFLPRIYDIIYAPDGFIYTVMDYIPGCNLQEYVERHGALSQKQCLKWLRQLCEVIAYLHRQKPPVIHCDIKPQNIMITPEGDICLIDFNISLIYEDAELNALGVTHGYAAPEQYNLSPRALERIPPADRAKWAAWSKAASGYGKITQRTDIYSIGAVACFMLTGRAPAHSLDSRVPLSRCGVKITDALCEVLERAMSQRPGKRFPSAQAMGSALKNLKKADRRYRGWKARCQVTAATLGTLALVSIFSIWMGLELRGQERSGEYLKLVAQADDFIARQQYEEGLRAVSGAIAMDGERIEAYIRAASVLYRLGRYGECVDLLTGINFIYDEKSMTQEEFDFAQAELNYVLGSCYFQEERYVEAVQSLELAVWFDGNEPLYCRDLAIAQAMRGNLEEAGRTYDTLKAMDNAGEEDVLLVEGELAYAGGRYEEALPPLLRLTQSRDSAMAGRSYLLAAQCCRHMGDLGREIEILEEACAVLDVSAGAVHMERLAEAYLQSGNAGGSPEAYERAYALCESLMERGTAAMSVRLNAGLALQYLGRVKEAQEVVEAVVADYPNHYRGYVRAAMLYLDPQVGDYGKARKAYEQAEALYSGAGVQDSEMAYLASLMQDLAVNGG